MKRKIILCSFLLLFFTQNIFAYFYSTPIFGRNGYIIFTVDATVFSDGSHVVSIVDANRGIFYCFPFQNISSAMEFYQVLSRENVAVLSELISQTKWEYWFTDRNIYYRANGFW